MSKVTSEELQAKVSEAAERFGIPGVSVGVRHDGVEDYAVHGVTNVEHPLPVDADTMFMIGSTGKLLTSTALVRLQEQGRLDLGATVRTYLPGLKLKDEDVARAVTVLQLVNHTSGWDGDYFEDTGNGDDALERYAELMVDLEQVTPPGLIPSYNNSAVSLAGRVVEVVAETTFEQAIRDLVFEPLGLEHSFYFPNDVMTRGFAVSHNAHDDGSIVVMTPWGEARSGNPAGSNIVMSARDLIGFGRFHMGDGTGADGSPVLPREALARMREATAGLGSTSLHGDHVGIAWFVREAGGVQIAEHGGDSPGQHCAFATVPERDFAVAALTNASPRGSELVEEIERWALEAYVGIVETEPEPVPMDAADLDAYAGVYETIAARLLVTVEGEGLLLGLEVKPEILAQFGELAEEMLKSLPPPMPLALVSREGAYVIAEGPQKGERGAFLRGDGGGVQGLHFGGRYGPRTE